MFYPLRNLLDAHPYKMIEKVETKAANSRKFRLCLSGVWQRDLPEEIWERLKVAIKNDWIDHLKGKLPED
jgi:hypothetical protein